MTIFFCAVMGNFPAKLLPAAGLENGRKIDLQLQSAHYTTAYFYYTVKKQHVNISNSKIRTDDCICKKIMIISSYNMRNFASFMNLSPIILGITHM